MTWMNLKPVAQLDNVSYATITDIETLIVHSWAHAELLQEATGDEATEYEAIEHEEGEDVTRLLLLKCANILICNKRRPVFYFYLSSVILF